MTNEAQPSVVPGHERVEAPSEENIELYGPPSLKSQGIVLVLGPGLARAFSAVGVLQVLHEAGIPIQAIYATELSSIVALSFTTSDTTNEMDWKLLRFQSSAFPIAKKGFMGWVGKLGVNPIEKSIQQAFHNRDLKQTSIPTYLCASSIDGLQCFSEGEVKKLLLASISNPSLVFAEVEIEGKRFQSGQGRDAFPVSAARKKFRAPIVVIDALVSPGPSAPPELEKEAAERFMKLRGLTQIALNEADFVITPDLSEIGFLDFDRRQEVIFRGKKAANIALETLQKLAGMQP